MGIWAMTTISLLLTLYGGGDGATTTTTVEGITLSEEEQAAVLALFHTDRKSIDASGELTLDYPLEWGSYDLALDFDPPLSRKNPAVRWARGYEGRAEGIAGGILIADAGEWFHKAIWAEDVRFQVEFMTFSGTRKKDLVAAVYGWSKGLRRRFGTHLGGQLVTVRGTRAASRQGQTPLLDYNERMTFGFELDEKSFRSLRTVGFGPKVARSRLRIEPGRVGLVWSGAISGAVTKVEIKGKLDVEWLAQQIPSIGERLANKVKKASR